MTSLTDRERFLTWMRVEQGRSDRTIEAYGRDIAQYESYLVGAKSNSRVVKPAVIEKYVGQLRANERAPKSIARQFAAIRMFHRFMLDEGLRTDNPTAFIDGVKVPSGIPKALSEEEVELLLNAVTGVDSLAVRDRALLEFLYATGARVSEACGLSMSDVDMESNVARVFGKGSKERIVPFGRHAKEALESWLGAGGRPMLCPQQWAKRDHADAVFLGVRGTRLSRQAAWGIVRKYAMLAGIKSELSPHVLRHSCATHMLVHGADLRIVQELLGHASVSTTQVYTKVDNEVLFEMYRESHPRARAKAHQ
ncbi:MAG: site-specific tyrosine recombinase XerD [Actinobacteria bacterium]|uniref:Tyrosine recombinase XerD n=1 Tax=freshwater metagenome TaxID=449393 RepID=A0A6J6WWS1_9ZZZZ|nr:site-specific tyrosine recombinase XerD [Actinomycetota bacterium]